MNTGGSSPKDIYLATVLDALVELATGNVTPKELAGAVGAGAIKSVGTMFVLLGNSGLSVEDRLEMLDAMAQDIRDNVV